MSRQLPSIVTNPAGMLQKLSDVGNWITSLRLTESGGRQNVGFSGVDADWAGRFAAAFWTNNHNGTTDFSPLPSIPRQPAGAPYCALSVTLILRLAAQYANDLTEDERSYYLKKLGNAGSGFARDAYKDGSKYLKKVDSPRPGTINCRGTTGSGHVNITINNSQKPAMNGNGSCKENIADGQRDALGGGICKGGTPQLVEFYLIRIGGKFQDSTGFIADNRVIDSTPAENNNNPSNNSNNNDTPYDTASNDLDLSSAYDRINAFLLTGKAMSDSVNDKKDVNAVENKDQETSTKILLNPTHELDKIINPGGEDG